MLHCTDLCCLLFSAITEFRLSTPTQLRQQYPASQQCNRINCLGPWCVFVASGFKGRCLPLPCTKFICSHRLTHANYGGAVSLDKRLGIRHSISEADTETQSRLPRTKIDYPMLSNLDPLFLFTKQIRLLNFTRRD